ncbi:hypothetical protein QFZ77_001620 [Paenibacillus sp. V4I3]|uniref:hypothetical protein n=1 Tax=Paenibacillus sp. V4I3 TaxID=3042305 RepID=UPI002784B421|nr:hypothetical protein [Paenibacillus sp. V4I3]MDQ0872961.1 hypothetical protein [Paenibacillus sp. V4I3]
MAQGNQFQSKRTSTSNQRAQLSQAPQTSSTSPQVSPLGRDFFMQMQRTAGNRATQAYANQLIQRNPAATQPQVVPLPTATTAPPVAATPAPLPTVATPTPVATQAPGTAQPAPGIAPPTTVANPAPAPAIATAVAAPQSDGTKESADMGSGVVSTFSDSFGMRSEDMDESFKKSNNTGEEQLSNSTGAVASTADLIGGPFQILSTMREMLAISEDDRTKLDYASAGLSITEAGGKMVSGSAGLIDKSAKSTGHENGVGASSSVSDYSGTVAEAITSVKSAILTVKAIYDLYSKHAENGGLDKGEKSKGAIEIISNAIQTAQSGLKVAKGIMKLMETSTASLTSVIPGVSIAVSGVKIAIKTVDVIKAGLNRSAMTTLKRDFKGKHTGADFIIAKRWFRNTGVDKAKLATHKAELERKKALGVAGAAEQLEEIAEYELAKEMKNINVKRTTRGGLQIGLELTKIAADIATLTGVGAQVGTPLKIVASGVSAAMPIARNLKQAGRDRASKAGAWGITKAVFDANKSTDKKREQRGRDADLILNLIRNLPKLYEPAPAPATAAPTPTSAPAPATSGQAPAATTQPPASAATVPAPIAIPVAVAMPTDPVVLARYEHVRSYVEAAGVSLPALKNFENKDELRGMLTKAMAQRE